MITLAEAESFTRAELDALPIGEQIRLQCEYHRKTFPERRRWDLEECRRRFPHRPPPTLWTDRDSHTDLRDWLYRWSRRPGDAFGFIVLPVITARYRMTVCPSDDPPSHPWKPYRIRHVPRLAEWSTTYQSVAGAGIDPASSASRKG